MGQNQVSQNRIQQSNKQSQCKTELLDIIKSIYIPHCIQCMCIYLWGSSGIMVELSAHWKEQQRTEVKIIYIHIHISNTTRYTLSGNEHDYRNMYPIVYRKILTSLQTNLQNKPQQLSMNRNEPYQWHTHKGKDAHNMDTAKPRVGSTKITGICPCKEWQLYAHWKPMKNVFAVELVHFLRTPASQLVYPRTTTISFKILNYLTARGGRGWLQASRLHIVCISWVMCFS